MKGNKNKYDMSAGTFGKKFSPTSMLINETDQKPPVQTPMI